MKLKVIWIALSIIVVIGLVVLLGSSETNTTDTSNNRWGASPANVIVTEALDFGCPACAQYHQLVSQYRSEFGDRVVFEARHFPIRSLHPNALAGHRAAEAAAKQGKFWEMHDLLFEQRNLWVSGTTNNPIPQLEVFAQDLGLDIDQFRLDFASAEINSIINNDIKAMKDMGVSSTPTFFLNGEQIDNQLVASPEEFKQLLEQALADAGANPASNPSPETNPEAGDETHPHPAGTPEHGH